MDKTFTVGEYVSATYGIKLDGQRSDDEVFNSIDWSLPKSHICIRDTLRTEQRVKIVLPHPDCFVDHERHDPPKWETMGTVRVFPNVLPEHVLLVEHFGFKNHIVNYVKPTGRPLTATWQ